MRANSLPQVTGGLSAVTGGGGEGRRRGNVAEAVHGRQGAMDVLVDGPGGVVTVLRQERGDAPARKLRKVEDGRDLGCVGCTCKPRGCRGI
jgi:hypothetical protein